MGSKAQLNPQVGTQAAQARKRQCSLPGGRCREILEASSPVSGAGNKPSSATYLKASESLAVVISKVIRWAGKVKLQGTVVHVI